jgi:HTH-type transcriptional regulator/antitoxin HipB
VAKAVGIKQNTVSKMEMNAGTTKVETLFKVVNSLGLELHIKDPNYGNEPGEALEW